MLCRRAGHVRVMFAAVLILGMVPSTTAWHRLRAGHFQSSWESIEHAATAQAAGLPKLARSLLSTRDPQCTMPMADPCTLNTTAIGMIEMGYATYYDSECEEQGFEGCFTEDVPSCRTCYLSESIYMDATNATEDNKPGWTDCPCCVPSTLADGHVDLEVQNFDFSVFNISSEACTDAPTSTPTLPPTPAPAPPTSAPTLAITGPPSVAGQVPPTSAPPAGDRELGDTPAPSSGGTTTGMPSTPAPRTSSSTNSTAGDDDDELSGAGVDADDADGGDDGLSDGAKIGIGAGVAAGVVVLGLVGFGALKAAGKI